MSACGLDSLVFARGLNGGDEAVVVAIGALGEDVGAKADGGVGRGSGAGVEFDDVSDPLEFAMGLKVMVVEGLHEREIFDGAVLHEEEDVFVTGSLVGELGEDGVGGFAGKAEVSNDFFAGSTDGEAIERVFLGEDIIPVDVEAGGGGGGVVGYGIEISVAVSEAGAASLEIIIRFIHVAIETVGVCEGERSGDFGKDLGFVKDGIGRGGRSGRLVRSETELGLEAGNLGSLGRGLEAEEDTGAEAGESKEGEDDDDREEVAGRFGRFRGGSDHARAGCARIKSV